MSQIYGVLGVSLAASAFLMVRAGLTINPASKGNLPYYAVAAAAAFLRRGLPLSNWRYARAVGEGAEYYALFVVMAVLGAVTSYPIAALTQGYADPLLAGVDARLHFNWVSWYRAVADHRSLQILGLAAYQSIYLSPAILLGWFAAYKRRHDAHVFLLTFWLAAVVTLVLFALMPAVGPFSFLWHQPIRYMPVSELWQPDLIPALRARAVHVINLSQLRGIVSAPSFHAAAATLYIVTAWRVRPLRWPLLWVNIAMLLATPVEGTHYLTDIILGMAVAVGALVVARFALGRRERCGAS